MGKEFEDKLIGMSKGEDATHEITFPENHPNVIIKGKTVEFKITVKDVKERILAALDDEFAKDASAEFNTLDELKESIRARRIKEREESAEGAITDRLMQKLLDAHDFEIPNRLVAYEIDQMIKQTEQQLEQSGMNLEAAGLSREKLAEENAEVAAKRVRGDFILKKIAEVEAIKVADEGPGIPDDQLEAVLQPFYRLENSRNRDTGGTGLGLAIAAQLAGQMAGKLTLRNCSRGGLEVSVLLFATVLYPSVSPGATDN